MRLMKKATGGSSGVPLEFDLNDDSNDQRMAAWHRGYGWAGALPGTRQWHLWGGAVGNPSRAKLAKDAFYHRLYRRSMASSFGLSEARIPWYLEQLNRCRPQSIVAYTNPLYFFASALEEQGLVPFSPSSIIVGAEKLHDFQRQTIERVFRAPVFETYGSREFMLIGGECGHAGLHLSLENLLVEILDDAGPGFRQREGNVVIAGQAVQLPAVRYAVEPCHRRQRRARCGADCLLKSGWLATRYAENRTRHDSRQFSPSDEEYATIRHSRCAGRRACHSGALVVNGQWNELSRRSLEQQIRGIVGSSVELDITVSTTSPHASRQIGCGPSAAEYRVGTNPKH